MGVVVLITGPLWAAKAWGVYWTWDPRLTTSMLSVLLYVAYVVLRLFAGEGDAERKFAAALGVLGAANLPIIHFSVQKWGGNHPKVITSGGGGLHDPNMSLGLGLGFLSFTLIAAVLLWWRLARSTSPPPASPIWSRRRSSSGSGRTNRVRFDLIPPTTTATPAPSTPTRRPARRRRARARRRAHARPPTIAPRRSAPWRAAPRCRAASGSSSRLTPPSGSSSSRCPALLAAPAPPRRAHGRARGRHRRGPGPAVASGA